MTFAYDPFERRIAKHSQTTRTMYGWDGDTLALESNVHHDHVASELGTPQELTDCKGKVAWSAQFKAWGKAEQAISDAAYKAGMRNPIRFQGQYFDDETGLHYNRHRYYDANGGRFISSDPIGLLGGLNVYQYAPNPTEWVDPLGLAKQCFCGCGPYLNQDAKWREVKNDPHRPIFVDGSCTKSAKSPLENKRKLMLRLVTI